MTEIEEETEQLAKWRNACRNPSPSKPSLILKDLFLGSLEDANNEPFIRSQGIRIVVTVADDSVQPIRLEGVTYVRAPLEDNGSDLGGAERAAWKYMMQTFAGQRVLVHCRRGVSRSASIVIGFLMFEFDETFEAVWQFVKNKRPEIAPHPVFINQLKKKTENNDNNNNNCFDPAESDD